MQAGKQPTCMCICLFLMANVGDDLSSHQLLTYIMPPGASRNPGPVLPMGAAMDYSQASTAEALMEHVHSQQFDHFSQVERQTLDSALAAAGIVLAAGPRVLDVGCGEGRLLRSWAARGAVCVGCDPSEALITAARAAQTGTKLPAIEYFTADATSDVLLPGTCSDIVPSLAQLLSAVIVLSSAGAAHPASCAPALCLCRPGPRTVDMMPQTRSLSAPMWSKCYLHRQPKHLAIKPYQHTTPRADFGLDASATLPCRGRHL